MEQHSSSYISIKLLDVLVSTLSVIITLAHEWPVAKIPFHQNTCLFSLHRGGIKSRKRSVMQIPERRIYAPTAVTLAVLG